MQSNITKILMYKIPTELSSWDFDIHTQIWFHSFQQSKYGGINAIQHFSQFSLWYLLSLYSKVEKLREPQRTATHKHCKWQKLNQIWMFREHKISVDKSQLIPWAGKNKVKQEFLSLFQYCD